MDLHGTHTRPPSISQSGAVRPGRRPGGSGIRPDGPSPGGGPMSHAPDARLSPYFRKSDLARVLNVGARTLDRLQAAGLLPPADLYVGRSPRWSPSTVKEWLDSKPRLPGRGS